jgi:hypothetical protein
MEVEQSFQIFLSSRSADVYKSGLASVSFNLPLIQLSDDFHIHISISHASIPVCFYNITRYNCNLWYRLEGGEPTLYQIPWEQYSALSLRTMLQTLIPNLSVVYSSIQNKYTFIHASSNFTLLLGSSCFALLGLTQQDHDSNSRTMGSDLCLNMSPVRMILVEVNRGTGNINKSSPNAPNILCCIPVTAGFGGVITFMPPVRFSSNLYTNVLEAIDIRLTDQDGAELDLNGCHWSMALQIDCERYVVDY